MGAFSFYGYVLDFHVTEFTRCYPDPEEDNFLFALFFHGI